MQKYPTASRAGKKLQMSTRGYFEGSEMSSKVSDFRQNKIATKVRDLRPILNTSSILDPQSSILDPQSSIFNPNPNHHPQYFLNPHPHPQS